MEKEKVNLSHLTLHELDIYKNHAMIYLAKLERLMGNSMGETNFNTESKEFMAFSHIYKLFEDEMLTRITDVVYGKSNQ
jgi:hypothetical protein